MRRALQILEGNGAQEVSSAFNGYHPYDHPYFGQILLAFMLKIVGYPSSIDPAPDEVASIEMLHLVPRIFMGILAVVDTFLVYKISRLRYNRNIAFAASILFAVMPMTWLLRRILLDSIFLPLLLSSVLFAVKYNVTMNKNREYRHGMSAVLLSGIFMGLAIFTKIPAFTLIPLLLYLLIALPNNNRKWMTLGIWFVPVILIPAIWPAYALFYGQFDQWMDGISSQTSRVPRSLVDSVKSIFEIDPVLTTLGVLGVVWTTLRRDFFFLFWVLPFMIFLGIVGYSQYIHMTVILPSFSMAAAIFIRDLSDMLQPIVVRVLEGSAHTSGRSKNLDKIKPTNYQQDMSSFFGDDAKPALPKPPEPTVKLTQAPKMRSLSSFPLWLFFLAVIVIFGIVNTSSLIATNVNGSLFEAYAIFVDYLPDDNDADVADGVTLLTAVKWGTYFYWIPKYVFDKDLTFLDEKRFFVGSKDAPSTEKIITIGGKSDEENNEKSNTSILIGRMDNTARHFDYKKYPFSNMKYNEQGNLDIKANY
jgi:dolichyl-phosphate-mannose-protein mannosyltransferase